METGVSGEISWSRGGFSWNLLKLQFWFCFRSGCVLNLMVWLLFECLLFWWFCDGLGCEICCLFCFLAACVGCGDFVFLVILFVVCLIGSWLEICGLLMGLVSRVWWFCRFAVWVLVSEFVYFGGLTYFFLLGLSFWVCVWVVWFLTYLCGFGFVCALGMKVLICGFGNIVDFWLILFLVFVFGWFVFALFVCWVCWLVDDSCLGGLIGLSFGG